MTATAVSIATETKFAVEATAFMGQVVSVVPAAVIRIVPTLKAVAQKHARLEVTPSKKAVPRIPIAPITRPVVIHSVFKAALLLQPKQFIGL